jgi:hypothetical protein
VELSQEDRSRIKDSSHNIQSANNSLAHVDAQKISDIADIQECLDKADKTLRGVLRLAQEPI